MGRPKILVVGEAFQPTGYARVIEAIVSRLAKEFEFHIFARSYEGPDLREEWFTHGNHLEGDPWAWSR